MMTLLFMIHIFAQAQIHSLVENGQEVGATEPLRKSVAHFIFPNGSCTASFLSQTTLLTAGHCIKGGRASQMGVRVRDEKGNWHSARLKSAIRHPQYKVEVLPDGNTRVANDFGIIKLATPLAITVRPLRLADPRRQAGVFPVVVAGYGKLGRTTQSKVLRRGRMHAQVGALDQFYQTAGLYMVPADARKQATCPGDSGGPVVYDDAQHLSLIGVHSLSNGCQGGSDPQSFSQLPALVVAWIRANR